MKNLKLKLAGENGNWFTTGLLIGIGLTLIVVSFFMYIIIK